MSWFDVDRDGLRQLLEGRDKAFILRELTQNVFDEPGVTRCDVRIAPVENERAALIEVEDDAPEGFYDLRHAYTLYAHTRKRTDPEMRGRFNLGEKQVLAVCRRAHVKTTTGTVEFKQDGERRRHTHKRPTGSLFTGIVPMTRDEIQGCIAATHTFLPPPHVRMTVNGSQVEHRTPLETFEATLTTEKENGDGRWKRTRRKTTVEVHQPLCSERAMLYEMGLPVVELEGGDPWHVNVMQRVPLNTDRDNVSPAFLRDVRAEVLNRTADRLTGDEASESWVSEATEDDRIEVKAVETVMTTRFGQRRCVADPNDPRSREHAIASGYTIIPPRAMSRATWANVRRAEAVPSSSAIFPTSIGQSEVVETSDWTDGMREVARLTRRVARLTLARDVVVQMHRLPKGTGAEWARGTVSFNLARLGSGWFRKDNRQAQLRLIIHELAHAFGGHIDESYYNGLARIGAKLAVTHPDLVLLGRTEE